MGKPKPGHQHLYGRCTRYRERKSSLFLVLSSMCSRKGAMGGRGDGSGAQQATHNLGIRAPFEINRH